MDMLVSTSEMQNKVGANNERVSGISAAGGRVGSPIKSLQSRDLPWWFDLYHSCWVIVPAIVWYFFGAWPVLLILALAIAVSMWFG